MSRDSALHLRLAIPAAILLVVPLACGKDYLHTNPYDPEVPVTITLFGPDTVFSAFEVVHYTAQTSPAFPDSAVSFASSDTVDWTPSGPGSFESQSPPLYPATKQVTVFVYLGLVDTTIAVDIGTGGGVVPVTIQTKIPRHTGFKNVILTQRVTKISLRCPDAHACDTLAVGGTWSVWADGFDATGLRVYQFFSATTNPATGPAFVTYAVRDTTVAGFAPVGVRVATVTAKKSGATWIVATRDTVRDSLRIVVK
jgi:hypothetical protein